jgi:CheY-like chemotaxis protein
MTAERTLIAVLNDEQVFLTVLQEFLWQEGYAVSTYAVDDMALHCLCSHPPALILLDINPSMEDRGVDLLDALQRDPILSKVPVIVMSVDALFLTERELNLRARGSDVLAEPFNLDDLKAMIDRLLQHVGVCDVQDGRAVSM